MRYLLFADEQPTNIAHIMQLTPGTDTIFADDESYRFCRYPVRISIAPNTERIFLEDQTTKLLVKYVGRRPRSIVEVEADERKVKETFHNLAVALKARRISHFAGAYDPASTPRFSAWDMYSANAPQMFK